MSCLKLTVNPCTGSSLITDNEQDIENGFSGAGEVLILSARFPCLS
jgi:hypothetical protein